MQPDWLQKRYSTVSAPVLLSLNNRSIAGGAAVGGRAIEVTRCVLEKTCKGRFPVGAVSRGAEAVQIGKNPRLR